MLNLFSLASSDNITEFATKLSERLKEDHGIVLKRSKFLNTLSQINGFSNWAAFKADREDFVQVINSKLTKLQLNEIDKLELDCFEEEYEGNNIFSHILKKDPVSISNYLLAIIKIQNKYNRFSRGYHCMESLLRSAIDIVHYDNQKKKDKDYLSISILKECFKAEKTLSFYGREDLPESLILAFRESIEDMPYFNEEDLIMGCIPLAFSGELNSVLGPIQRTLRYLDKLTSTPVLIEQNISDSMNPKVLVCKRSILVEFPELEMPYEEKLKLGNKVISELEFPVEIGFSKITGEEENIKASVSLDDYSYPNRVANITIKRTEI